MATSRTAIYAGSFDPPTLGHLAVARRAAALFAQVVVAVGINAGKRAWLTADERVRLLRTALAGLDNVTVETFDDAVVALAGRHAPAVLLRGLRSGEDADAEYPTAEVNRVHGVETLCLLAEPAHRHLSSRLVREVARASLPLDGLVDAATAAALRGRPLP